MLMRRLILKKDEDSGARPGMAWQGWARRGVARQGKARQKHNQKELN